MHSRVFKGDQDRVSDPSHPISIEKKRKKFIKILIQPNLKAQAINHLKFDN